MPLTKDYKNVMRAYNKAQADPDAAANRNAALTDAQAEALVNAYVGQCERAYDVEVQRRQNELAALVARTAVVTSLIASAQTILDSARAVQAAPPA